MSVSEETRARQQESALRRWARPGERERASERQMEAQARAVYRTPARGSRTPKSPEKCLASIYMDRAMHAAVAKRAVESGKSFNEIVRTYVQWGLETEGLDYD